MKISGGDTRLFTVDLLSICFMGKEQDDSHINPQNAFSANRGFRLSFRAPFVGASAVSGPCVGKAMQVKVGLSSDCKAHRTIGHLFLGQFGCKYTSSTCFGHSSVRNRTNRTDLVPVQCGVLVLVSILCGLMTILSLHVLKNIFSPCWL